MRLSLFFAGALVLWGCGDDAATRPDGGPDAPGDGAGGDGGGPDAPDAPPPSCDPAALVDLDPLAAEDGGVKEARFSGDTTGRATQLEPLPGCSNGPGGAPERVHRFTAPAGDRLLVLCSTAEPGTSAAFDSVVYVRARCTDGQSQLACNDDTTVPTEVPLASRTAVEVGGGAPLYVVVDGYDPTAFGAYALRVRAVPALPDGANCDPRGLLNACRGGHACTIAGGPPPHCAPGTPPTGASAQAQILENGRSGRVLLTGGDVDGDALSAHLDLLDAAGSLVGSAERPLPAAVLGQTAFGPLVVYSVDGLFDLLPSTASARVSLLDAVGLASGPVRASFAAVPLRALGQGCDPAGLADLCQGELACTGAVCQVPAGAPAACAAAQPIVASGMLAGTLPPGPGVFEGRCAFSRGLGDAVYRLSLPQAADVSISTDPAPSDPALDTVIYLRRTCTDPASQLACNDDLGPGNVHSQLQLLNLAAGDYFLFVDGSRNGAGFVGSGPFGLSIQITPR